MPMMAIGSCRVRSRSARRADAARVAATASLPVHATLREPARRRRVRGRTRWPTARPSVAPAARRAPAAPAASCRRARRSCRRAPTRSMPSTCAKAAHTALSRSRRRGCHVGLRQVRAAAQAAAGSARRSSLPLAVIGSASSRHEGRGHHEVGQALRRGASRSSAAVGASPARQRRRRPAGPRRPSSAGATTAQDFTAGCAASAASISPSSMRKPRILTWPSARPMNSSAPSGRQRTRSPVR